MHTHFGDYVDAWCCRGSGEAWHWEHEALMHLDDAVPAMQMFLLAMVADKTIPLPGDVDIMTGGPPCQVRCAGRDAAVSLWGPAKRQRCYDRAPLSGRFCALVARSL